MSVFAAEDAAGAVWRPDERTLERSRLLRFMRAHGIDDVEALHRRAIDDPEWHWRAVVEDLGIEFQRPFDAVLDLTGGKPFPRWFPGGRINLSANCVDRWAGGEAGGKAAVVWEDERGATRTVSYRELLADVVALARFLRSIGVGPGDRVGLFLPMIPQAAVTFLACARVGAVAVPAFSGYGPEAVATRLDDCEANVLVTADGFARKGRIVPMGETARSAAAAAPTVHTVVMVAHTGDLAPRDGEIGWEAALAAGEASGADGGCAELDPNHPLMIIYTSGTTGRPKGIVHSHAGFLVKTGHDFGYSLDLQDDDTLFWITDLGWLVGPLLIVGALMLNATAVYFEGVPDHPDPGRVWSLVDRHRATVLGISPTAVRSLMAAGDEWVRRHDLGSLRAFVTTGEPWNPEPWTWLFEGAGGGRLPILNYSGGTEIGGGILTCYPTLPLKPCAFNGPVVGMDADVLGEGGRPVRGEIGELVVRTVWPGMAHGFWQDRERYLETYWSQVPDTWVHGDLAVLEDDGFWYVRGRSDDTIKVAGKRIGPAEVESALVAHEAVVEAAVIGVPDEVKGQAMVGFVVTTAAAVHGEQLERAIRDSVGERLGRTLVPAELIFVDGLPKTRNGKIVRRVIRARHLGLPPGDLSSLESADALGLIPEAARA